MKYICKNLKEVEQIANYKCYDKEKINTILGSIQLSIMNEQYDKDHIQISFKKFENDINVEQHMMYCVGKCTTCSVKDGSCEDDKLKEVNVSQMFRELKLKRII